MAKVTRNKIVKLRLTPAEKELAEQLALNERITVSDLIRARTFNKSGLINQASLLQPLKKTGKALLIIETYLAQNSEAEDTCHLLQQVRAELIEARTLISKLSTESPT